MKPWKMPHRETTVLDVPLPDSRTEAPKAPWFECLYGPHKADLLHKGTAYCRSCYDKKNREGNLIN